MDWRDVEKDFDVGAAPNVINLGPLSFIGVGDKNGTYYLLTAARGQLVWSTRVVFGGGDGGFFGGAAFDGRRIFSATGFGDGNPQKAFKDSSSIHCAALKGFPSQTL